MKVAFWVFFLAVSSTLYGGQPEPKEIIIHGSIKNTDEIIPYVYLICLGGESLSGDSIKVINNRYTCKIKTNHVAFITFYAKSFSDIASLEDKNHFTILVESGNCNIVSVDFFSNIKVTGSRTFMEYINLKEKQLGYSSDIKRLQLLIDSLQALGNISESDIYPFYQQIGNLAIKRNRLYLDYAESFPSSLITPFVLSTYFRLVPDSEVKKNALLYNRLTTAGRNSEFGEDIKSRIEAAKIGVGTMAPEFMQPDTSGRMISLHSLRGKYVLLDFWASWCLPCRSEHTHLTRAFKEYYNKGFTIVSISLDKADAKDKWLNAINNDGLTWFNISDLKGFENAIAKLYHVRAIPQNFLIDPWGKIVAKNLRNGNLEKKLSEIFSFK